MKISSASFLIFLAFVSVNASKQVRSDCHVNGYALKHGETKNLTPKGLVGAVYMGHCYNGVAKCTSRGVYPGAKQEEIPCSRIPHGQPCSLNQHYIGHGEKKVVTPNGLVGAIYYGLCINGDVECSMRGVYPGAKEKKIDCSEIPSHNEHGSRVPPAQCHVNDNIVDHGQVKDITPKGLFGARYRALCNDGRATCTMQGSYPGAREEIINCSEVPTGN